MGRRSREPVNLLLYRVQTVQTHRSHQIESIASFDHAGPHPVVEDETAVFEAVFEVHVCGLGREFAGDPGERKVVRGDQADGLAV